MQGVISMAKIEIDAELCKGCKLCIAVCPQKIIVVGDKINSKGYSYMKQTDDKSCTACKLCAIMCPDSAITVLK